MHWGDAYLIWHCRHRHHCYFVYFYFASRMHSIFIIHFYWNISCFHVKRGNVALCTRNNYTFFSISGRDNIIHVSSPVSHCCNSTKCNKWRNNKQQIDWNNLWGSVRIHINLHTSVCHYFLFFFLSLFLQTELENRKKINWNLNSVLFLWNWNDT